MSETDKDRARAKQQRRFDVRHLMAQAEFRRFAAWLVRPVYRLPYGPDDRSTAFKAGQWQAASEVRDLLQAASPDLFQKMEREAGRLKEGVHEDVESLVP